MKRTMALAELEERLRLLSELEMTTGRFYQACAERWPVDREFWLRLCAEELKHAQIFDQILAAVSSGRKRFAAGRSINPIAISTVRNGIAAKAEKVARREMSVVQALAAARDIERSLLEQKMTELFVTDDAEYEDLARRVVLETRSHQARIEARLREAMAAAAAPPA